MKFVLSGGGVRGFAHAGVLQALREHGIEPSAVSATSAGSIVGAFIADGFSPEEIREIMLKKLNFSVLFHWENFRSRLISLEKFGDFMRKNLRRRRLEELPMPFYVATTNFVDGSQRIFTEGDIVEVVKAACSIPALFPPITIDGVPYVDGGMYNNLPVEPFEHCKQEVIAVYVNPIAPYHPGASVIQTIDRSVHLSFARTIRTAAEGCRLYIEPPELHRYMMLDVPKLAAVYQTGYDYTRQLLEKNGGI